MAFFENDPAPAHPDSAFGRAAVCDGRAGGLQFRHEASLCEMLRGDKGGVLHALGKYAGKNAALFGAGFVA